jgi:serine/threonine-protein kinase LegK1
MHHLISIDPAKIYKANLTASAMEALHEFIEHQHINDIWFMNQPYNYNYKNTQYIFCFTRTLLRRQRKNGKEGDRFEIFDSSSDPLGQGGYASVYPLLGTIRFEAGKPILKVDKNRIVKIEHHDEYDRSNCVVQEYNHLLHVSHLAVKPPVFISNQGKQSLLVMKRADGFALEKIVHPIKRRDIAHLIPNLTVAKRLEITLAIINAVKEQVTDKGLVHRDLKPGNMMIDLSQSPPKVTIIDYGNAITGEKQEYHRVGTTAYRAPEVYRELPKYTEKSDAYSVGRILSYVWGDRYQNYYIPHATPWHEIKRKSTNEYLFSDPDVKLFKRDRDIISQCLSRLLNEDFSARSTLNDAIRELLKIDARKYQLKRIQQLSKTKILHYEEDVLKKMHVIHALLHKLSEKGLELCQRGFDEAGNKAIELAQQLQTYSKLLADNPDPIVLMDYRKTCLKKIDSARGLLQQHRDSRWLIAEVITAFSLLGVGYLFAAWINYQVTGRVGLFSQTKTGQLTDEIRNSIYQIM